MYTEFDIIPTLQVYPKRGGIILKNVYAVLFFIGVIYTGITFLLGSLFGSSDIDMDGVDFDGIDVGGADFDGIDVGSADFDGVDIGGADLEVADVSGAGFDGGDVGGGSQFSLPIKPFQVVIFLTALGGSGLIMLALNVIWWVSIILSVGIAFLLVTTIDKYIYKPLIKSQTTVKKQAYAIGLTATVLEKIPENGFGRISYTVSGNILSAVAKSKQDGIVIPKGAKVVIKNIHKNIFYVTEIRELEIKSKK